MNKEKEKTPEEKKHPVAVISALTLEALAPLIQGIDDFRWSEEAFYNQVPTYQLGTYILPVEKGCLVLAVDFCRYLAIHDEKAKANMPVKIYFPKEAREAATRKFQTLINEDGASFEIPIEPQPDIIHCNDVCCIIAPSVKNEKKHHGVLGSFSNQDFGNTKRMDSYRCEPVEENTVSDIKKMLRRSLENPVENKPDFFVHLPYLEAFAHAASTLETVVEVSTHKHLIQIKSANGAMFGVYTFCHDVEMSPNTAKDFLLDFAKEDDV